MKIKVAVILFLIANGALAAEKLPLADGVYKPGRCGGGKDIMVDIVISGGGTLIGPSAESGFPGGTCEISRLKKSGTTVSGSARCMEGARGDNFMGDYEFS